MAGIVWTPGFGLAARLPIADLRGSIGSCLFPISGSGLNEIVLLRVITRTPGGKTDTGMKRSRRSAGVCALVAAALAGCSSAPAPAWSSAIVSVLRYLETDLSPGSTGDFPCAANDARVSGFLAAQHWPSTRLAADAGVLEGRLSSDSQQTGGSYGDAQAQADAVALVSDANMWYRQHPGAPRGSAALTFWSRRSCRAGP